jgi:hypothetical protein
MKFRLDVSPPTCATSWGVAGTLLVTKHTILVHLMDLDFTSLPLFVCLVVFSFLSCSIFLDYTHIFDRNTGR